VISKEQALRFIWIVTFLFLEGVYKVDPFLCSVFIFTWPLLWNHRGMKML